MAREERLGTWQRLNRKDSSLGDDLTNDGKRQVDDVRCMAGKHRKLIALSETGTGKGAAMVDSMSVASQSRRPAKKEPGPDRGHTVQERRLTQRPGGLHDGLFFTQPADEADHVRLGPWTVHHWEGSRIDVRGPFSRPRSPSRRPGATEKASWGRRTPPTLLVSSRFTGPSLPREEP